MSNNRNSARLTAAEAIALIETWWPHGRADATRDGDDFVVMWIPCEAWEPEAEINPDRIPEGRSPLGYRMALFQLAERMGRMEHHPRFQ